jgi:hypothetical protein
MADTNRDNTANQRSQKNATSRVNKSTTRPSGFQTNAGPSDADEVNDQFTYVDSTNHPEREWEISYVVVGIPAYNAESTIGSVVEKASSFADHVLVVDDGSSDETAARAREAGAAVITHKRNRGYGGALKTVFREVHNHGLDLLVTLDADEQHDPATIPKLVEAQHHSGADVIIGSRFAAGSTTELPFVRSLGLSTVNLLTNWSMGRFPPRDWIRDTQSGLRAYTRDVVESLATTDDVGDGMWASTDILYHSSREGFLFVEVGTTIHYDVEHGSTEGAFSHGLSLVKNISRFAQRNHPIVLLGMPGTICVVLGLWSIALPGSPLVSLLSIVLAISATVVALFGLSFVFLGVLLHAFNIHPFFNK